MNKNNVIKNKKRFVFQALVFVLAIVILIPQFNSLLKNADTIESISFGWIALAFGVFLFNIFLSSASYIFLSPVAIPFLKTMLIQTATGFTNRILPSGTGALALNTVFLKKSGNSTEQSLSIVMINNLLGFIGFIIVMIVISSGDFGYFKKLIESINTAYYLVFLALTLLLAIITYLNKTFKLKFISHTKKIFSATKQIFSKPFSTIMSLFANCGITVVHVFCLILCIYSVGYNIPISAIAVVFFATIASISVSPTPNGLGVTEVVMTSTLQLYGIPNDVCHHHASLDLGGIC
jgi:uncharacterized protein (TIRG00374 family)